MHANRPVAHGETRRKMIVVDDSNVIRNRIARAVDAGKIPAVRVVGMANNGKEALRQCRELMPDVVTMDLTMPEMDGIACTESLVRIKPDVLILVVSALSDKATALEALQKGAHGFVCKPFTDDELANALNELLGES